MMMTMRITVKKAISLIIGVEALILLTYLISFEFFINLQIAYFSSLFIILGSMYAHQKMVTTQVENGDYEEQRDLLDKIEDPHELYEDNQINNAPSEELDLKAIVQEEKKKIKIVNFKEIKRGSRAGFSLFRLLPYGILIMGFVALKNNNLLELTIYMPSLLIGIVIGALSGRLFFMK